MKKTIPEIPVFPPYSDRSERAVLGTLLRQNEAWKNAERLVESDFYISSHQRIFACIRSRLAIGRPIDFILAMNAMERQKELDAVGGPEYLAELTDLIPRNFDISAHVAEIREKSKMRELLTIFDEGMKAIYAQGSLADIIACTQAKIVVILDYTDYK